MNSNISKKPLRYRNGKCRDSLESPNFKRDKTSSERLGEKNLSTKQNNTLIPDNTLKQPKQLKTHLSFGAQSGQNLREEAMVRTTGQLDPEMIESAHHRFQNRSSNQLEFSAQRDHNFDKLSGSRRQIMSKMIDKQSGTQIVMLEGEKTESASHQETDKRLEEFKMMGNGQDSNASSLDSGQSREEEPVNQINSLENPESNNTKKQLEIEVDHENKTFSLTSRKLSPDVRMKSGTFSPQSQPPPGSTGQSNNGRKNSYQLQKFAPTELSVSAGKRQTTIKQITLENVELEARNNNMTNQQQNKAKSRSGFQGTGSKSQTGTNYKRPSNPSASPTISKQAARDDNYSQQSPLKITKMQVPKKLDPATNQVSKSRKAQLKHSQQSVSEDSSSHNANKTPSPQPDKSHLNVKLPQFMQSTMNDGIRNCLHQQNQKEPAQAFSGGESARRSLKSSQEMGQGQKSSRGPQMRDAGLRNSDQVETKFGSVAAPSLGGVPQQTHITRSSNASNPETEAEKIAKMSANQAKKSIPLSKTQSTRSKVPENEDHEIDEDDTPYGGINDTEFKKFLLLENQNQKTPQTVMELDRTQRGSIKSRDDSRLVDLGLPSTGVHNVTFLHQNHHHLAHFPYEQYYLGQDFYIPQSKTTTTARHSSLESDGQIEKNYDLYIDTKKGKVGLQSSKIPTCTYRFLTARGPAQGGLPQKAKKKQKSAHNLNQILSHSDKQQFLQVLEKYAKSDDSNVIQVILMKLWRLSHRYKEHIENQSETKQTKNQSTHGGRQVLQHEPMKLISVRVLHQISASFSMALLLFLNFRDILSTRIRSFVDFDEEDSQLFDSMKQNFQIHHVKLPLQKVLKQIQNELKVTSKEQKQKILNKPICAFDEFKVIILSVFGQNLVKIYEQEGRIKQSDDQQKEDDSLYPQPQLKNTMKYEPHYLLNSIIRYTFLILTSKHSTLKRDESRQDYTHQKRETTDENKLRQMIEFASKEAKVNPRIRAQINQILEIFNYAESKEPKQDLKHEYQKKDAVSPMEESLRKYRQPLLGKIYNREGLSYGVAKDPLKIKTKKPRTDTSQNFQSLQEPKRATKEGFQNYQFSAESGFMSTKANSKKVLLDDRAVDSIGQDKYDEEINGIVKVKDLLGRPATSSDTRFKHSFVNLNSRLQRNIVSQRQKYRSNIQTRRNLVQQQSKQNEHPGVFMLNHARDDHIGKLTDNAGAGDARFQTTQDHRQDGFTTERGSTEALSQQVTVDVDSRPKSMNIARRPKAYANTKNQSQLSDMANKFESTQAPRPSTTKNQGRPSQGISIKANLRQSSQPEIQEIAQANNTFRTVINSPSAGTYAPKFKGQTIDIKSKVGSLRAADKAVYEKIREKLNPVGVDQSQSFSRSRIQQQMPILQQKVAGVLSDDLYSAKMKGEAQVVRVGEEYLNLDEYTALFSGDTNENLDKVANMAYIGRGDENQEKIISINSDQFDFASDQKSESPSALNKYVRTLQMWSEQGKEELKSIRVVAHGHKSMSFKMHNSQTGNIGDGTLDQRGFRYGDMLRLYPQQQGETQKQNQDYSPTHKPEKPSKEKKQIANLETRSPDSQVNASIGIGIKGNLMTQNEQARRLEEYKRHYKQQAGMFKLKKDSHKSDGSKNPPLTIGNKIKITQLQMNKIKPNTMNFNIQEQAQKTTGRFVEVQQERPGKTPPLPSVDMAESLGVSTNRLKPSDNSDISLHAKVQRPRMLNPRPVNIEKPSQIDIITSKNELSGSPGTVLIPSHGLQYKKQSTLLLKKLSSVGKNDNEIQA